MIRKHSWVLLVVVVSSVLGARAFAQAGVPQQISFTGNLNSSGLPVTSNHKFDFTLYDALVGGTVAWTETYPSLPVTSGMVYASLGSTTALTPTIFNGAPLFLEIAVDGVLMTPRLAIQSVPYAIRAAVANSAEKLGTMLPSEVQRRVTGACAASGIASINADGGVTCAPVSGGTVTGVTATPPLLSSGGNAPDLSMPQATNAVNGYLSRTDWLAFSAKQERVGACGAGSAIQSVSATGLVTCQATGTGTVTGVTGTAPIASSGGTAPIISVTFGTTVNTVAQGNDSRFLPPAGVAGSLLTGGAVPAWSTTLASLSVTGAVTAASFVFSPAKLSYLNVQASGFTPSSSTTVYNGGGTIRYVTAPPGTAQMNASVSLPQGAVLQQLSCKVFDNDAANDITFLGMAEAISNSWVCLANPPTYNATTGSSAAIQTVTTSCGSWVVDNTTSSYFLRLSLNGSSAANMAIYGCTVSYTMTTLP